MAYSDEIRDAVRARRRIMISNPKLTRQELDDRDLPPPSESCCTACRVSLPPGRRCRICYSCLDERRRAWIAYVRKLAGWQPPDIEELKRIVLERMGRGPDAKT